MRLRLLVLVTAALLAIAPGARAADRPAPAVTSSQAATTVPGERSAPVTVLLVGVGAVVGVMVGMIPALVVAMLLGYLPPPRLAARRGGLLVEPARAGPASAPMAPVAPAPVVRAAAPQVSPAPGVADPPPAPLGVLAQARHQSVYDAAYTEQTERAEALRAAIGGRLRKRPGPPSR